MEGKVPMTLLGYQKLEDELRQLRSVERPAVIRAIAEAREHGDLKENAEYHAARERQSFIEGRIMELESKTGLAEIIDTAKLNGDIIMFGASIVLVDDDNNEESRYQIVGEDEANIKAGLLSITSPLARALIGKRQGENVEVKTPKGAKGYEITSVFFE